MKENKINELIDKGKLLTRNMLLISAQNAIGTSDSYAKKVLQVVIDAKDNKYFRPVLNGFEDVNGGFEVVTEEELQKMIKENK